jgi:hypothetical protein
VALRDVASTGRLFVGMGVPCLPAPFKLGWPTNSIRPAVGFAHILHNVGFADVNELASLAAAWDALYDLVEPDVILFDHSPIALLASRGRRVTRVIYGDGFCCPPVAEYLPALAPRQSIDVERLHADETRTLATANRVLADRGAPRMQKLSDLYGEVNDQIFTTLAELDHFGPRSNTQYFGPVSSAMGATPRWPHGDGPRAVAYVRRFEQLPEFIRVIEARGVSTLLCCPDIDRKAVPPSKLVRVVEHPIDLGKAASHADLAILNASHATTAEMLLCGIPVLQLPTHMEQRLVADCTSRLGAGLTANRTKPTHVFAQLSRLLECDGFRNSAAQFSSRYRNLDPTEALERMIARIESSILLAA